MKRILLFTMMAVVTMAASAHKQEITVNNSPNNGIIKTTNTNYAIKHFETIKKHCPKTYFDALINEQLLSQITNYYFFDKLPQDTIEVSDAPNTEMIEAYKKEFAGVDFKKYDKEQTDLLSQNTEYIQMKRGEFWDEVYKIHRKYAAPDGFALIEKQITEIQAALGLNDTETVFIKKNALKVVEASAKHIFTEMRDKVNTAYLR